MLTVSTPRPAASPSGRPSEDPPVLSLTHFSRPPFVSFGCVRTGTARSSRLLLQNPNPEPVRVTVHRLPEQRGFTVSHTDILIAASETIPLTVTWTPLEEGAVRELITFVVNDVVKHQAVLLGRSEAPTKKKNVHGKLRNTMKKRGVLLGPKVPVTKRTELALKGISKTDHKSQESTYGKIGRARSPLLSCENYTRTVKIASPQCVQPDVENRTPVVHPSLLAEDKHVFTDSSLRRSKTYSVLCVTECSETLEETTMSRTLRQLHIDEDWTFNDQIPRKSSMSPINPAINRPLNVTCTPIATMLSPTYPGLSPTEFYNPKTIQTGASTHIELHVEDTSSYKESSQDGVSITSSRTNSPSAVLLTSQRTVSSPDSLASNGYFRNEVQHTPYLSPDQFVKENCITLQSVSQFELSLQSLTPSKDSMSSFTDEEDKTWQLVSEHVDFKSSCNVDSATSRLTYCVKKKRSELMPVEETCHNEPKKPPIDCATVIKTKASDCNDNSNKPIRKSRRRLENIELETDKKFHSRVCQSLPIISTNQNESGEAYNITAPTSIVLGQKRKSDDFTTTTNAAKEHFTEVLPHAKKINLSKTTVAQVGIKEKPSQHKRAVKSPGKRGALKAKSTMVKTCRKGVVLPPPLQPDGKLKNIKHVVAVAQSRLNFMKPSKTVIPRHPMPFAAKNMFYDERWMAKQERGFTWWLNFILTPDDFAVKRDTTKVNAAALILEESSHKISVPKAPTKDEVSLKAYTARCRLNRLRRSACRLFTSEPVVKAIRRLEVEIEARRLLVRKDRHLWKDIGERQKILNWLLSYNPLWLRVGLETVFGELISLESNSDITGLALFILNRLLWNPDIAAEYRHPSVPNLYRDGHEEALSKFTLKKLLLLVFFLDHAKQSRLIDHDPCLFWKDAEFKTSKDLLLAFSRDFLSGEGDLSRHLYYLGLPVSHSQTHLDEFDFAVTNLAMDLHCGVRLVRMMELLTQNWDLSKKLRVPAISRLQKMHNVEVALQVLMEREVQIKDDKGVSITSKDIVDRHRERTLALLWRIVFTFQVDVLLSIEQLKDEIRFLKERYSVQKKLAALRTFTSTETAKKRDSDTSVPENYNERMLLLMEWVNAVCAFYSSKVENFTVCFSDGRIICYLINHYHPSYLPLHDICQRTTQTIECTETGTVGLNCSSDSDSSLDLWPGMGDQGFTTSAVYKELLENERKNYSLIHTAVSNLGGIPTMIHHSDMSNTIPDEKVVIIYLSFLCVRLLDLCKEARAARVIQAAWRKYRLKAEEQLQQRKHKAACIIKAAIVRYIKRCQLKKNLAAVVFQKWWRRHLARKQLERLKEHLRMESQAVIIQRFWRGYLARKRYIKARHYIILLQAKVRTRIAVASYNRVLVATVTIQHHLRSWLLTKRNREKYIQLKSATVVIQSAFRRWKRKHLRRVTEAALVLQNAYRRWSARKLRAQNTAAVTIQSLYRMHRERQNYLQLRYKVIKIQSWFRGMIQRKAFLNKQKSALMLQIYYRAYRQGKAKRQLFLVRRSAAISIQRWFRSRRQARSDKEMFLRTKRAIVCLQAGYRGWTVRKRIRKHHLAAICIQSEFRRFVCQKKLRAKKNAAVKIQQYYQALLAGRKERQHYLKLCLTVRKVQALWRSRVIQVNERRCKAATLIQSYYRMHACRAMYSTKKEACTLIQQQYRAYIVGKSQRLLYLSIKAAAVVLQAAYRGWNTRRQVLNLNLSASIIQASYRSYKFRKEYVGMRAAALSIQRYYRATICARLQQAEYMRLRTATIKLQSSYRGMKVRRKIVQMNRSAVIIQSWFRMHQTCVRYQKIQMAAVHIQVWYRAVQKRKEVQKHFLRLKKATCVMQAAWRGRKVREQMKHMHKAATVIQSWCRMYKEHSYYQKLKVATVAMQQRYRSSIERKNQVDQYKRIMNSVLRIQAAFREMKARQEHKNKLKAATVIQSSFKAYLEKRRFLALRRAAIIIQQRYRMKVSANKQRLIYIQLRKAAVVVQAVSRGRNVRRKIRQMHASAVVIQAAFRMHKTKAAYHAMKHASIIIQRWYRTCRLAVYERKRFLMQRQSVVLIQAAYRGAIERQRLRRMIKAASKIQAYVRMFLCRDRYQELQWAVCVIQQRYRANKMRDFEVMRYTFIKESALCIQAAYRSWKARKREKKMNEAAIVIQRLLKTYVEHKRFISVKAAAVVLQRRYRATVLAREHQKKFKTMLRATVCIQTFYRGAKVRKELLLNQRMATKIQSTFRMYRSRKLYQETQSAATVVQTWYRSVVICRQTRASYLELRWSTIRLQAAYRGLQVRTNIKTMHRAATIIQSYYRMQIQCNYYKRVLEATRMIQKRFRETKIRNSQLQLYQNTKKATILLQAAFRGMKARKRIQSMHRSSIIIQRCFRAYIQKRSCMELKCAVVCIQRKYKSILLGRSVRREFLAYHKATVCIQAAYRGFKERKALKQQHKAATKIQSVFRMHRLYVKYQTIKLAAISIQSYYRLSVTARHERDQYVQLRKASIVIQAAYRATRTRKNLKHMFNAAAKIQASYRMHVHRRYFLELRRAARTIQQRFRANRERYNAMRKYRAVSNIVQRIQSAFRARKKAKETRLTTAATMIQSKWKMYRARREFVNTKAAAITIQAAFRGYKARTIQKERKRAACYIQRWYRSNRLARLQRAKYTTMRQAALAIQSAFRRIVARQLAQRESAARKLQSVFRVVVCRKRFLKLREAAITLQSYYRLYRTWRMYRMKRDAALLIQRWYRSCGRMKHQRETYLELRRSVICLQAAVRGYRERQTFTKIVTSAVIIQVFWRGFMNRRLFLQYKASTLIIQQRYRAMCLQRAQRDNYLKLRAAAIKLQAIYRGSQARKLVRRECAACVIQRFYKCYMVRRDYITMVTTVRTIQSYIRTKQERVRFLKIKSATVCIQRRWRETIASKMVRQMFLRKRAVALRLQSAFRGHIVRRDMLEKQNAACIIQASYKGFLDRRNFIRLKAATVTLQTYFRAVLHGRHDRFHFKQAKNSVVRLQAITRGWLVRKELTRLKREANLLMFSTVARHHLCAMKIQRRFRIYLALKRAQKQISHVICIQRWFRSKLQRRNFLITRGKVVLLQHAVRTWLHHRNEAARKIQSCVQDFLLRRKQAKVKNGIVKFQALWRGYTWRKINDTKALCALRKRLQNVNQEIKEENKLYNRTSVAVGYLLSYKHLSYILAALQHLEVATRLSALCCENMAKSGAVRIIFTLIRSCNRSIPCMEVIKLAVQVLLNLSKYEGTVQVVYEVEKSVDVLLDLMQIYREKAGDKVSDKGGSIFTKTCCLLAIFAQNSQRAQEICSIPKALDRIRSIYKLTCRKHMMDTERNLGKRRMSTLAYSYNMPVLATPARTKVVSRIRPDWVLRKDNMREIVDPLKAIRMVMDTLSVPK
ncbi:abnormal spindle-like microcephaly-associated [Pelobates cultripes]|uniref:Abnormal spindle-like microcephaly-associated n=1 Tax=Pelobates cultripes TaxID=61616 RepID=A0AAD1WHQ9_PELCU|nr:abnormal spindle-like microcephaly-associated [Pelobates cultripes]